MIVGRRTMVMLCVAICLGLCSWLGFSQADELEGQSGWNAATAVATPAAVADAAAASERAPAATRDFKRTLNAAATAAYKDGKLTRWQLARLRLAITFRPDAMAEAQACVIDQGIQDGVLKDGDDAVKDGFDWSRLLEFIKQLLPLIMQIIAVFQ